MKGSKWGQPAAEREMVRITAGRSNKFGIAKPKILYPKEKEPVETLHEKRHEYLTQKDLEKKIKEYEKLMKKAAKEHRFEDAARFRDLMHKYERMEMIT